MTTGFAKISVQKSFCDFCSTRIREELLKIKDITNVYLFPNDSMVVFNFVKANELSTALNVLTSMGYPPKGDKIPKRYLLSKNCGC